MQISEQLFDALKDTLVDLFYGYKFNIPSIANKLSNITSCITYDEVQDLARDDMLVREHFTIEDTLTYCYQKLKWLYEYTKDFDNLSVVAEIKQYYYLFDFYMSILAEMEYNGELPGV